ncbi:MAG: MFS transporter [Clostridiales bacterium]|jgi:MFS family permease|nr:MFS transporter [Clostridiales bacterium]
MWFCRIFNGAYRGVVRDDELLRKLDLIAISAAVGTILFSNTGGAALTGYASAFGAGEFMFGLISALPVLGSLMQLFVSYMILKTGKRKALFMVGGIIQRTLWTATAAIPYFCPEQFARYRVWVLLVMITLAAMSGSFVGVTHTSMVAEVVPIDIRGRYLTTRQRITTIFSLLAGLGASYVLDHFTGFSGYTFVFAVSGLAGLTDILLYVRFRFPETPRSEKKFSLADGFRECFRSPKTRNFLIFWAAWGFAINFSSAFFSKYAIDVLKLSFTQIILFGQIASNVAVVLIVRRWGRFIDRYGCAPLVMFTGTATAVLTLIWLPATPGNFVPLLLFNLLGGFVWCANDVSAVNMQLSHTPDIGRPLALAIYAVVTSVAAAVAFISGGAFLELTAPVMARAGLTILGTPFDHYKLLFCIATALRLAAVLVFLPRVWNEKEMTVREVYADIWRRLVNYFRMLRVAFVVYRRKKALARAAAVADDEGGPDGPGRLGGGSNNLRDLGEDLGDDPDDPNK